MRALLAATIAICLVAMVAIGGRLTVRLLLRADGTAEATTATEVVRGCFLGVAIVAGPFAFILFPIVTPVADAAGGSALADTVAYALNAVAMVLVTLTGLAAYRRTWRPYRLSTGQLLPLGDAYRRRWWLAHAASATALSVGAHLVYGWRAALPGGLLWLAFVVGLAVVGYLSLRHPLGPLPAGDLRHPTDEERQRIATAYDAFGRSPGSIVVFADEDPDTGVVVSGRGALETLWIRESLLEAASDDDLAACLAYADERAAKRVDELVYLGSGLGVVGIVAILFTFETLILHGETLTAVQLVVEVTVEMLVATAGLKLGAERTFARVETSVFDADRGVADALGVDTVRAAYESYGRQLQAPFGSIEPGMEARLERLRDAGDGPRAD
jgi:hypothetical protein